MSKITFFTPSYRGDAERFLLLRDSIKHFYKGDAQHIVVVPSSDISVFKNLCINDSNIKILIQDDYVDPIFYPKPFYKCIKQFFPSQAWRFQQYAGKPGWIIQQIVKLNIPAIVSSGVVVILDSDLFFVRPFSDADFKLEDSLNTLYKVYPESETGKHKGHMQWAREFLGLESGSTDHHYISFPTILYPELVSRLQSFIENKYNKPWQLALFESKNMSEYILYGVFLDEINNAEKSSVSTCSPPPSFIAWDKDSYHALFEDLPKHTANQLLVIIQSNLNISASNYEHQIRSTLFNNPSI